MLLVLCLLLQLLIILAQDGDMLCTAMYKRYIRYSRADLRLYTLGCDNEVSVSCLTVGASFLLSPSALPLGAWLPLLWPDLLPFLVSCASLLLSTAMV